MDMIRAKAVVTMTVEVHLADRWGTDCPVGHVWEQGVQDGTAALQRLVKESKTRMRIIGDPEVRYIIGERD